VADGCVDQPAQGRNVCGNGLADENWHASIYTVRVYPRLAAVGTREILIRSREKEGSQGKAMETSLLVVRRRKGSFDRL